MVNVGSAIRDYQSLRQAASQNAKSIQSEMSARKFSIQSAQIDSDNATVDTIVVRAPGNGAFSGNGSAPAQLTFSEVQQDGHQVLNLKSEEMSNCMWGEMWTADASIDLTTGNLISSTGKGTYFIETPVVAPPPPPGPSPEELRARSVRAEYAELKAAVGEHKVGDEFFSEQIGQQVKLEQAGEGSFQVSYWGGAFSGPGSGTLTESFREFSQDGKAMLAYSKVDPGDFMGMGASTEHLTVSL